MKRRAFTLIELLIVVAIIAILAAIAVPNFLEAQTRARHAKAVADMRSVATAIETYKIDNNKYSTDCGNGAGGGIWRPYAGGNRQADPPANFTIGFELTTPVAYLTSTFGLKDPYKIGKERHYAANPALKGREYYFFMNIPLRKEKNPAAATAFDNVKTQAGEWVLWAAGPDGWCNNRPGLAEFSELTYIPRGIQYDASNGTVSNGDVHRTQKHGDGIGRHPTMPLSY